jgi:hypothetical protein
MINKIEKIVDKVTVFWVIVVAIVFFNILIERILG